jgi:preprotein translocase subunit SecE
VTVSGCGPASRKEQKFVSNWTKIIIWVVVVAGVFGYLWWQGQIRQLATYVQETREELKKCSWPSWAELKGSTVVIMISILMLGAFTEVVDRILYFVFFII